MDRRQQGGFTLVEIMIVVTIVGLLAGIAVQTFNAVKRATQAAVIANDFRKYANDFQTYCLEEGYWPAEADAGVVPEGMEAALTQFHLPGPVQGSWDWDYDTNGITAGLSLVGSNATVDLMEKIDNKLDDGQLDSGRVLFNSGSNRLTFILEP